MSAERLRVLISNEDQRTLDALAGQVAALGHETIGCITDPGDAAAVVGVENPDVALVGVGTKPDHALEHIAALGEQASCPVIAVIDHADRGFGQAALERGIFAIVQPSDPEELRSAIEVGHRRFTDYKNLRGAFDRRAVIERAKGVLMERHGIDEREAFERLRGEARKTSRKLVAVAQATLDARALL
jgi:response regulator NasT